MTAPIATLIYKQTILPVLEYCGFLYNGTVKCQQKRLQLVQNRCLRVCLNVKMKYSTVNLHVNTKMDYLYVRYNMQLLLMIYGYLNNAKYSNGDYGLEYQSYSNDGRITRAANSGLLRFPAGDRESYRKSPLYRAVELWNSLSSNTRLCTSKEAFKAKAKPEVVTLYWAMINK